MFTFVFMKLLIVLFNSSSCYKYIFSFFLMKFKLFHCSYLGVYYFKCLNSNSSEGGKREGEGEVLSKRKFNI